MPSGENVLTCENDELGVDCRFSKHGQACKHMYTLLERTQVYAMQKSDGTPDMLIIMGEMKKSQDIT